MKSIKWITILFIPLILLHCGDDNEESQKKGPIDLNKYGLDATINAPEAFIKNINLNTNQDQKVLVGKTIKVKFDNLELSIWEVDENRFESDLESAKNSFFDDTKIVLEEEDAVIVENVDGVFKGFEVIYYTEGQGGIFKVDIQSKDKMKVTETLEEAKKGLEIARSLDFK